jgi:hypothetical protein
MHGNHLKHMLIGGAVVLAALLIVGVPLGTALPYAALLACPLMMISMMLSMNGHGGHGGHGERDGRPTGQPHDVDAGGQVPEQLQHPQGTSSSAPRR